MPLQPRYITEAERAELVRGHVALARWMASRLSRLYGAREDWLSESYLALVKCSYFFDPRRGWRFSTFAIRCIQNYAKNVAAGRRPAMLRLAAGGEGERLGKGEVPEPSARESPSLEPDTVDALRGALRRLPARERQVMRAIAADRLQELQEQLGVSRQWIHQLKLRALRRLREDPRLRPE
jgi:RNA polymerase sigma factor (sigma-70 family)